MELLIDISVYPHLHHPFDIAGSGTESQTIEDMERFGFGGGFGECASGG